MLNEKTESKSETMAEELKRITDPKNVGAAVAEIKAHIDASEARILAEIKSNRDWWKDLVFQALRWLEGKVK